MQVVVLVLNAHRMEFLLKSSPIGTAEGQERVLSVLDHLKKELTCDLPSGAIRRAREDVSQLCNEVIRQMKTWKTPSQIPLKVLTEIVTAAVELNDKPMFLEIYKLRSGRVSFSM